MNGTSRCGPASSVPLNFPSRSTSPVRACGMIRTDLASVMTTNSTMIAISAAMIAPPMRDSFRLVESGFDRQDGVDQRGHPADLEHLDQRAGRDREALVVRPCRPVLAVELHPARLLRRDRGRDDGL